MFDSSLASPCGVYCKSCEYFSKSCDGCRAVQGKPFWASQVNINVCPLYDCPVNKKNLEHCGLCDEMPCKIFFEMRDPSWSDEQFNESIKTRKSNLLKWKETGSF